MGTLDSHSSTTKGLTVHTRHMNQTLVALCLRTLSIIVIETVIEKDKREISGSLVHSCYQHSATKRNSIITRHKKETFTMGVRIRVFSTF